MKTKIASLLLCLTLLVITGSILFAQNNKKVMDNTKDYTTLWKSVEKSEQASLPKSAMETVDVIYQKALKEKNSPELLKSLIHKIKYQLAIDNDKFPQAIREVEKYTAETKDVVEQSMLYSMIANLYMEYYNSDSYTINRRTAVKGYIPDDMEEWSGNIFIQKITENTLRSIEAKKELQSADALTYKTIMNKGETSRNLRPTLYDFLVNEAIQKLTMLNFNYSVAQFYPQTKIAGRNYFNPANEFVSLQINANEYDFTPQVLKLYQELLAFRLKDNNKEALLMVDLDRLHFAFDNSEDSDTGNFYMNALNRLEEQYKSNDFCVEILYNQALYYSQSRDREIIPLSDDLTDTYSQTADANNETKKAYEICLDGIKRYPTYERIGLLTNLLNQLTNGFVNVEAEQTVYPGKDSKVNITYRNIQALTVEIYNISAPITEYTGWERNGLYKKAGKLIDKQTIELPNAIQYLQQDTTINLSTKNLPLGIYEFVMYADKGKSEIVNKQFSVSRLATISRAYADNYEILVVDLLSGHPIPNAKVNFYKEEKRKITPISSAVTDKNGLAKTTTGGNYQYYNASVGEDVSMGLSNLPWNGANYEQRTLTENLSLFTDRSIYRPGQTVFVKGIAYELNKHNEAVTPDKAYTLYLKDSNGENIAKQDFKTNPFGSFSGEFVLPQHLLNGTFSIGEENNHAPLCTFRVEEYKRPTFDMEFLPVEKTYSFGDEIEVQGLAKTYSGVNLQDTDVKYRIVQRPHWHWGWRMQQVAKQVGEGTVRTNEKGEFSISFKAEKLFKDSNNKDIYYTYSIETQLTDSKGETQESSTSVSVGDKSMFLSLDGLDNTSGKLGREKNDTSKLVVNARNLNNKEVPCKGTFEVYSLKGEQSLKKEMKAKDWTKDKLICSGTFISKENLDIPDLKKAASGQYRIVLKSTDDKGREISAETDFTLYSLKDNKPPVVTYEWVKAITTTCAVGEKAEILYGSSAKNVYVLYEIFKGNEKLEASRFELNNESKKLEIPFKESYGEGVIVSFTFVKDGRVFEQSINLYLKRKDKSLQINLDIFRDNLLPGQKEEWKISVKDNDKNPVSAEVLAGMYDASLDKILAHSWYFNPTLSVNIWKPYTTLGNGFTPSSGGIYLNPGYKEVPAFAFDSFNWFDLRVGQLLRSRMYKYASDMVLSENAVTLAPQAATVLKAETKSVVTGSAELKDKVSEGGATAPAPVEEVQIRQNFNETAFFYPQLRTNENGETLISFTVPESNTTWKFMALSHTRDLKYGQVIAEAISRKKLMITPNMPRFVRQGDKTSISSTISNLSEENLTGKIGIEFFDPQTEKPSIVVANSTQSFTVPAGQTTAVEWTFDIPSNIDITACKIVAQTESFSDGEQHLLPVLPNRMMVTESLPLYVTGKQSKNFTFNKLVGNASKTAENYRLTLEFASNPTWYAIQALPDLTLPDNENAVSWFAAYYANTLAASIANSNPKIKQIVDTWTKQGGTKETFLSNLEKNRELKAVLLEETPWVLQAKSESEQKQRLSLLFDINHTNNSSSVAIKKLQELQQPNGGWCWFKGMNSNVSITQWILYGMRQLSQFNAIDNQPDEIKVMQLNAIAYIDENFKRNFEDWKKQNNDWQKSNSISSYQLEYLFVRSFYKDIPLGETKEAVEYYTNIVEKYWAKNTNLYTRSISAVVMKRSGKDAVANNIIQSLREHVSHSEELGMYWANNNALAFMFQSATAIHTFIMEAFSENGATQQEMDEMKCWLLKQKQTQWWESTPATVNAIYVLLKTGNNWLDNDGNVSIQLGKNKIDTNNKEAGTGYIKQVYEAADITPEMGKVSVSKQENGPAWGALYWQYYENLDKITSSKTGLGIDKKLFVEKVSPTGKSLEAVTSANPLKVGSKAIVRLTVRVDRDMEYVMLKDMRGSCFEPAEQLSGIKWKERIVYYQTTKDASTNFYFYNLPKGTYVFEYPLFVNRVGEYSNGITTIQCMYAPEFTSHSAGERITVE